MTHQYYLLFRSGGTVSSVLSALHSHAHSCFMQSSLTFCDFIEYPIGRATNRKEVVPYDRYRSPCQVTRGPQRLFMHARFCHNLEPVLYQKGYFFSYKIYVLYVLLYWAPLEKLESPRKKTSGYDTLHSHCTNLSFCNSFFFFLTSNLRQRHAPFLRIFSSYCYDISSR